VGSEWERDHLAFRDALRRDAELAAEYQELKERLAAAHAMDMEAYLAGKDAWIHPLGVRLRAGIADG
jgi:GrpB-like predicted nucleotidyltransferase (UPF0157 family)